MKILRFLSILALLDFSAAARADVRVYALRYPNKGSDPCSVEPKSVQKLPDGTAYNQIEIYRGPMRKVQTQADGKTELQFSRSDDPVQFRLLPAENVCTKVNRSNLLTVYSKLIQASRNAGALPSEVPFVPTGVKVRQAEMEAVEVKQTLPEAERFFLATPDPRLAPVLDYQKAEARILLGAEKSEAQLPAIFEQEALLAVELATHGTVLKRAVKIAKCEAPRTLYEIVKVETVETRDADYRAPEGCLEVTMTEFGSVLHGGPEKLELARKAAQKRKESPPPAPAKAPEASSKDGQAPAAAPPVESGGQKP